MNFGVAVGSFTSIFQVTRGILLGCFGQGQVNFGVALGVFTAILHVT